MVQRANKARKDRIDVIETGEYRYDIGAGVCVLLGEDGGEKGVQGLLAQVSSANTLPQTVVIGFGRKAVHLARSKWLHHQRPLMS